MKILILISFLVLQFSCKPKQFYNTDIQKGDLTLKVRDESTNKIIPAVMYSMDGIQYIALKTDSYKIVYSAKQIRINDEVTRLTTSPSIVYVKNGEIEKIDYKN